MESQIPTFKNVYRNIFIRKGLRNRNNKNGIPINNQIQVQYGD